MLGEIAALVTALLWSGTSISFSEASVRIGALQLNITRLFLAAVFLSVTIFLAGFSYDLTERQIMFLAISGFVGFIFGDSFLFRAFKEIGPRMGMLLMSLVPAISSILAFFFLDEILRWIDVAGIVITITGIVIVVLERNPPDPTKYKASPRGIFYGTLGALGQAVGLILAKFAFEEGDMNGFVATFVRVFAAFLLFLPLGIISKRYKNPVPIYRKDPKALLFTISGSILGPFLGVTGSLIAISNAKIGIASTLMATVPIMMLPLVRIIYKQRLTKAAILGAGIAVVGVAILFLE
ncbi:MAG: EamA family transporter [Ectothiorhodospiraceae bacterium]|nr:EamA family transporter [Ectothiorhodospiraceae bacterium]